MRGPAAASSIRLVNNPTNHQATDGESSETRRRVWTKSTKREERGNEFANVKGIRTLIVEDNLVDQKVIMSAAIHLGLRASLVDNGNDAIELLRNADHNDHFDLILIDYKMPDLDGLTASRYIKQQLGLKQTPRIILLSSYHQDEIFPSGNEASCIDQFVTKPIYPEQLGEAITQIQEEADPGSPWPARQRNDESILANCHVLLAEDNAINQRVAIGILERKGIKVTVANNGEEALERVMKSPPQAFDAILMDVDMPKMDGFEATRKIKAQASRKHIPVIALTAHNSQEDRQKCFTAGMSEYLTKPIRPNFLYETLLTFLRE